MAYYNVFGRFLQLVGYNYWLDTSNPIKWLPLAFSIITLWSLVWKGMALWRAARLGSKGWFVALLIINTLGILEIIYLYLITKPAKPNESIVDK